MERPTIVFVQLDMKNHIVRQPQILALIIHAKMVEHVLISYRVNTYVIVHQHLRVCHVKLKQVLVVVCSPLQMEH